MPKPTSKPDWTVGNPSFGTVTIEPSAGKKQTGWTAGERPAHQTMNWLFFNQDEWVDYLEEITDALVGVQNLFDAVVGTGGTHSTLADLVADAAWLAGTIKSVIITSDQTISVPITLDQDDVTIQSKPGVTIFKGVATRGFIVDADRVRVIDSRFANFNGGADAAVELLASSNWPMVMGNYFLNNTTEVLDSGATGPLITNNIEEV